MRFLTLTILFCLLSRVPSYGQAGLRDTSILIVPITMSYSFQLPQGDMADRFGFNHNIGLSAGVKFRSNYMLGLDGSFIFGNNVRERGLLSEIVSTGNVVVAQDGKPAQVFLYERGYTISAFAGKLIPVAGPNPNSGLLLKLGAGYMRHKIRVETQTTDVPALEGEYLKGYDRLSAGPMVSAFIGYQHLSNNKRINFLVGFQMDLAFTEQLRPFNFNSGRSNSGTRFDGLNGIRVGWTLPISRSGDDRVYFR